MRRRGLGACPELVEGLVRREPQKYTFGWAGWGKRTRTQITDRAQLERAVSQR